MNRMNNINDINAIRIRGLSFTHSNTRTFYYELFTFGLTALLSIETHAAIFNMQKKKKYNTNNSTVHGEYLRLSLLVVNIF